MNNDLLLIAMAALFTLSILIILIIVLNNAKKTNDLHNELTRSIYDIRSSLNNDFLQFNQGLNNQFSDFSERVNSNIIQANRASNDIYNNLNEKLVRIDEAQKGLQDLSKEMDALTRIFADKKSRGAFGEVELYALLENAYGNNSHLYQKQYKLPNNTIADAVILGPDTYEILCIDAKFPLENYRRSYDDDLEETSRESARKQFREDIRKHLSDIHSKYIIPGTTADLAYMFIPSEAIFSEIYGKYPELIELSYKLKVYIVSPTTLMAYITAIRSIYLGHQKDEKAKEIESLLADLSNEFRRFEKRTQDLYRSYEALNNAFSNMNISSQKIIRRFNRINSGDLQEENGDEAV